MMKLFVVAVSCFQRIMIVNFLQCSVFRLGFCRYCYELQANVSGFVVCQNNHYMRHDPNGPRFMSLSTFIDWFFAWASRMKIEFRQRYSHCGDRSKILACDGTKIGTNFKNIFVRPIETIEK